MTEKVMSDERIEYLRSRMSSAYLRGPWTPDNIIEAMAIIDRLREQARLDEKAMNKSVALYDDGLYGSSSLVIQERIAARPKP